MPKLKRKSKKRVYINASNHVTVPKESSNTINGVELNKIGEMFDLIKSNKYTYEKCIIDRYTSEKISQLPGYRRTGVLLKIIQPAIEFIESNGNLELENNHKKRIRRFLSMLKLYNQVILNDLKVAFGFLVNTTLHHLEHVKTDKTRRCLALYKCDKTTRQEKSWKVYASKKALISIESNLTNNTIKPALKSLENQTEGQRCRIDVPDCDDIEYSIAKYPLSTLGIYIKDVEILLAMGNVIRS